MSNPNWQDVALHRAAEIADLRTMLDSERRTTRDALSELASMTALCDRLSAELAAIRALTAPAAPKAPERGACDDCDGTGWLTFSDGTRAKCMACSGRGVTGGAG